MAQLSFRRIIFLVILGMVVVLVYAMAASAQERKISASVETVVSTVTTSWDMPQSLLARGISFNGTRWKPVTNILTITGQPTKRFSATLKKDIAGYMNSNPVHISSGAVYKIGYTDYRGNEQQFEVTGDLHFGIATVGGGWTNFGISEQSYRLTNLSVYEDFSREYRGFLLGGGVDLGFDSWNFDAGVRYYPRLTREDSMLQDVSNGTHYDNGSIKDASGFTTRVAGSFRVWKMLSAKLSYDFRTVTTDDANSGIFGSSLNEKAVWHSVGFGGSIGF